LSGLPLEIGDWEGGSILRTEYMCMYLQEKVGLDPHVTVEVTRESHVEIGGINHILLSVALDLDAPIVEKGEEIDFVEADGEFFLMASC
jgi:hypothetical protein